MHCESKVSWAKNRMTFPGLETQDARSGEKQPPCLPLECVLESAKRVQESYIWLLVDGGKGKEGRVLNFHIKGQGANHIFLG